MKRLVCFIILWILIAPAYGQQSIHYSGQVYDTKNKPLADVNVYIKGSIDGAITDASGAFAITTSRTEPVTIVASIMGYSSDSLRVSSQSTGAIRFTLKNREKVLEEVVITAGNYLLKGTGALEQRTAVDLATTAGSEGDLFKGISPLPGNQAPGPDGRLLVRGGGSEETQTYIDDMHLLAPYNTSFSGIGSRSRYSPFLFEGISFSMGGYSPEYSQSMSAVLPLYTKNVSPESKTGLKLMNVMLETGGTQAWGKGNSAGSVSFNVNYTDLSAYNELFYPSVKKLWERPYRQFGAQNQLRFGLGENLFLKTYFSYDKTSFILKEQTPFTSSFRNLDFNEDNFYLNTTLRKKAAGTFNYFIGAAYSWNRKAIENARTAGDTYRKRESELHLKSKGSQRFSDHYKLEFGAEAFLRNFNLHYRDTLLSAVSFRNPIYGLYVSNDFLLLPGMMLNLSSRLEYMTLNKREAFLPRVALNYQWKELTFSGVVGNYQQTAENDDLIYARNLRAGQNTQYLAGIYYQGNASSRIFRLEFYHKQYRHLTCYTDEIYRADGNGSSRGIDLFINDRNFLKHWEYTLGYSYNDSKRRYRDYPERGRPSFATRHNASLVLKYTHEKLKSIIGLTNQFASGRPYHDPNRPGFMNAETPFYHSLDVSWTFLAHKRLIIYASASNILNRNNVYGYEYNTVPNAAGRFEAQPVRKQQPQAFYIGFFFTLSGKTAYDVSNF